MNKTEPCDVTFEAAGRFFLYFFLFCSQAKAEHEAHVSQLNEEEAEIEKVITKFRNNLHF